LKTAAQITARIQERYNGLTKEVKKGPKTFTYIPWTAMCDQLDDVFGWDGWSAEIVSGGIHYAADDKAYAVAVNLEVYVWDEEHQTQRTIKRPGIGVDFVKYDGGDSHDAAKGARSDALVVAARTLGDLFGRFLSAKETATGSSSTASSSSRTSRGQSSGGDTVTAGQRQWLEKYNVPQDVIANLQDGQASALLDRFFNKDGKYGKRYTTAEALDEVLGIKATASAEF
jgi:hypothetical protein